MAKFNKGIEASRDAAKRSGAGNSFTPSIYWEPDEKKYIQILESLDDLITVDYHAYIKVGERKNGKDLIREFVSPQDSQINGAEGYDPIKDRFGIKPKKRSIALAVELKPITEQQKNKKGVTKNVIVGFEPVMRTYTDKEGEEHEVPHVGLINESPHTFWPWLLSYHDDAPAEDKVFAVTCEGKGLDKKYHFVPAGDAVPVEELDLDEEALVSVEDHLEALASEERMHELIDPLPDDYILNRFAQKKDEKPAKAKRTRAAVKDAADEVEEADEPEDTTSESRDDRFAALRKKLHA